MYHHVGGKLILGNTWPKFGAFSTIVDGFPWQTTGRTWRKSPSPKKFYHQREHPYLRCPLIPYQWHQRHIYTGTIDDLSITKRDSPKHCCNVTGTLISSNRVAAIPVHAAVATLYPLLCSSATSIQVINYRPKFIGWNDRSYHRICQVYYARLWLDWGTAASSWCGMLYLCLSLPILICIVIVGIHDCQSLIFHFFHLCHLIKTGCNFPLHLESHASHHLDMVYWLADLYSSYWLHLYQLCIAG